MLLEDAFGLVGQLLGLERGHGSQLLDGAQAEALAVVVEEHGAVGRVDLAGQARRQEMCIRDSTDRYAMQWNSSSAVSGRWKYSSSTCKASS